MKTRETAKSSESKRSRTDKRRLKDLGTTIRAARKEKGLSQEELGFACGLDRTYISGVERGLRNPTVLSLWGLAKALKLHPSDLLRAAETSSKFKLKRPSA